LEKIKLYQTKKAINLELVFNYGHQYDSCMKKPTVFMFLQPDCSKHPMNFKLREEKEAITCKKK